MTDEEDKNETTASESKTDSDDSAPDPVPGSGSDSDSKPAAMPVVVPEEKSPEKRPPSAIAPWKRWAFAIVPAVGVIELVLHVAQTHGAPSDADWDRARLEIALTTKSEDLVVVAPDWVDPLAREKLGEEILTIEREARPDDTRFPRAIELSMRGKHLPELQQWKVSATKDVGPFVLTTYENPAPVKVIDDLLSHMASRKIKVFRLDGPDGLRRECSRQLLGSESGNIGFGPAVPADRFVCQGGEFVGISVVPDLDYVPHRCFFAPLPGNAVVRVEFSEVHFGKALHGHHGISVHAERDLTGAPVSLLFRSGSKVLGKYVHRDGDGWKGFEADTSELAGTVGELAVEISATSGANRQYCFEADTR